MKPNPFTASLVALGTAFLCLNAAGQALDVKFDTSVKTAATRTEPGSHAVTLTGVKTAFTIGDRIGVIQSGADCKSNTTREWSELIRRRVETDLPEVFREQMAKAKVTSIAAAGAPGGTKVNAVVNDLDLHLCDLGKGAWRGTFHVQVNWQVVSSGANQVIYQGSTDGSFARDEADPSASAVYGLREAFAVSVRNLLADRRFASALRTQDEQGPTVAAGARY